jgi:transcriptional regulator with XRE-family HTH domain
MLPTITEVLREKIGDNGHPIAMQTGVDFAAIYRFLKGERSLTLPTAEKLCAHLNLVLTEAKPKPKAGNGNRTNKSRRKRTDKK